MIHSTSLRMGLWFFPFITQKIATAFGLEMTNRIYALFVLFVAMSAFEKTKPICRPMAGNPKI